MPLLLIVPALLILAAYGCYAVIAGLFDPWAMVKFTAVVVLIFGGIGLAFRFAGAAIDRWGRGAK